MILCRDLTTTNVICSLVFSTYYNLMSILESNSHKGDICKCEHHFTDIRGFMSRSKLLLQI